MNRFKKKIFFIYDTSYCKSDEDDPKNAVIFFYPLETCETQRYTFCCQLVGIAQFLKRTFSKMSNLILDHGRFVFHHCKNFLFVLGGNYDTECTVLKKQLMYLCETFNFYHGDITAIFEKYTDRERFLDKMELIWTDLLYVSEKSDNSLQNLFATMPFSLVNQNSSICRKAGQLLQMCQLNSAVIAGAVFHNNFMLSTQLTPELTSYLSIISHSSSPSICDSPSKKSLPPGVELTHVYISKDQIERVMNLNHKKVGSVIRVQSKDDLEKPSSLSNCDSLNSGSEGDIDSENCSDHFPKKHDSGIHADSLVTQSCSLSSDISSVKYSTLENKKFRSNSRRNSNMFCKVDGQVEVVSRKMSLKSKSHKISEVVYHLKKRSFSDASNLICAHHAMYLAEQFTSSSRSKRVAKSHCDFEFSCNLCTDAVKRTSFDHLQMAKHWNSSIFLSQLPNQKETEFNFLIQKLCFSNLINSSRKKGKKLQVLRCRYSGVPETRRRQTSVDQTSDKHLKNQVENIFCNLKTFSQFPTFKKSSGSIAAQRSQNPEKLKSQIVPEGKSMQEVILLNHRYQDSNLVLLLNSSCNQKVIDFVWNCGFSTLKDLELASKRNVIDQEKTELPFCIFLYNVLRKTLTNSFPNVNLLMEMNDQESVLQNIHQDFLEKSSLSSICLLTTNKSVFAQQYKHHHLVYLQKENPSRNLTSINNLIKKAAYRITKGFKDTLKH